MIVGDGSTAALTKRVFGDQPWLWICDDTPLFDDSRPDNAAICKTITGHIEKHPLTDVVISSQIPVGTCRAFESMFPARRFAVIPENFRPLSGIDDPSRLVIGTRSDDFYAKLRLRFVLWPLYRMSPESAEMVKHGLNGFLAMSIGYAQELARIAEENGANPDEVAEGIMTDPRVGDRAYLKPVGEPGPNLMREVHNLAALGFHVG